MSIYYNKNTINIKIIDTKLDNYYLNPYNFTNNYSINFDNNLNLIIKNLTSIIITSNYKLNNI